METLIQSSKNSVMQRYQNFVYDTETTKLCMLITEKFWFLDNRGHENEFIIHAN